MKVDEQLEIQLLEALDRVAQGKSTIDDAKLLAAASGVQWKPNEPKQSSLG